MAKPLKTVSDLIEALQALDPTAEVLVDDGENFAEYLTGLFTITPDEDPEVNAVYLQIHR